MPSSAERGGELDFQLLEPRKLLAGIFYDTTLRQIQVEGTANPDRVLVSEPNANTIRVEFVGVAVQEFARATSLRSSSREHARRRLLPE